MSHSFICNEEQIDSRLDLLQKTGISKDETDTYFVNPITREPWILATYESEQLDCDIQVLMKGEMTSKELIDVALTSNDLKTVAAAAMTLKFKVEQDKSEFRHALIQELEKLDIAHLPEEERERIRIIIYESDISDGTNQRSIMNKHWTEIQKDADFYQIPANKAKEILKLIK
jgi:hypothetical protein